MPYNYNKYKDLPVNKQAIIREVEKSNDMREETERRISINIDNENYERIKTLIEEGYTLKEHIEKDMRCIFTLVKGEATENITIKFHDNVNKAKKTLGIS